MAIIITTTKERFALSISAIKLHQQQQIRNIYFLVNFEPLLISTPLSKNRETAAKQQ